MKRFLQKHKESSFTLIITIILLILSTVLNAIYNLVGIWILLATLILLLCVVFMNTFIVAHIIKDEHSEKINSYIKSLKNHLGETKTNLWLYSEEEIAEYERNVNCELIILLSPDLKNDSGDSKYVEMVKEVINRNIKYCYIVPENPIVISRINDVYKIFKNREAQLNIIIIPQSEFNSLTTTTVVIYMHNMITEKKVAIELPVFDGSHWWAIASKEQGDIFLGKMYVLLEKTTKKLSMIIFYRYFYI